MDLRRGEPDARGDVMVVRESGRTLEQLAEQTVRATRRAPGHADSTIASSRATMSAGGVVMT